MAGAGHPRRRSLARALDTITGADPTRLPAAYRALAETCRRVFDHPVLLVLNGLGRTPPA